MSAVLAGKQCSRLLFFWDYDTQWGADRSRSNGGPADWGALEFEHTDRLLDLHAQYDIPACFAVVGSAALPGKRPYHDPHQVRRIHAAGHEIASHSFQHEWLPALSMQPLLETLSRSKDALEQCIGAEVVSFVPPFNQPFDYPEGLSFSLSERFSARGVRTNLGRLCMALKESGYRFCRVAYRSVLERLVDVVKKEARGRLTQPQSISGITCVRLTTQAGFDAQTVANLDRCVESGGMSVVYGHPHSLQSGNSQDERWLVPFLERVQKLCRQGLVKIILPRELIRNE